MKKKEMHAGGMKENRKKTGRCRRIAWLLAFVMLACSFPMAAWTETETPPAAEAGDTVSAGEAELPYGPDTEEPEELQETAGPEEQPANAGEEDPDPAAGQPGQADPEEQEGPDDSSGQEDLTGPEVQKDPAGRESQEDQTGQKEQEDLTGNKEQGELPDQERQAGLPGQRETEGQDRPEEKERPADAGSLSGEKEAGEGTNGSLPGEDSLSSPSSAVLDSLEEEALTARMDAQSGAVPVRGQGFITVTVTILGDEEHNSDEDGEVHTFAADNLIPWVPAVEYTDVPEGSTVWDLLQRVFEEYGIECEHVFNETYGSEYIQAVTFEGIRLVEKGNGEGSGWMYKLNGKDVETGVSAKQLSDGDDLVFHYTDDFTKEEYGDSEADIQAALDVDEKIEAIGTVTLNSEKAINAARAAYNALTDAQKQLVTGYAKLTAAEKRLEELKNDQRTDEEKAAAVIALINKIGTVNTNSGKVIQEARKAFDALTAAQKKLVTNSSVLANAEVDYVIALINVIPEKVASKNETAVKTARKAYDSLKPAQKDWPRMKKKLPWLTDAEAVLPVEKSIGAIGTVTLKSETAISKARQAYNRLTAAQKKRVASVSVLTKAEKKLKELKEETGISYEIRNLSDLEKLRKAVNENGDSQQGKVFRLMADITLPADWTPVGTLKKGTSDPGNGKNILPFSGVFDGNGHTLTVAKGGTCLFGYLRGATVKNLKIYGERIVSDGLVANYTVDYGPSGSYSGTASRSASFENITIKSGTQTLRSGIIGGIAGSYQSGQYSQTTSENNLYFKNCTVEAGVVIGYDRNQSCIGSLAGHFNGTMENCSSQAAVYGRDCIGGLIGYKSTSMGDFSVYGCSFSGSVNASGSYAGGIVGSGYDDVSAPNTCCVCIENCSASGSVAGSSGVGGILGAEPGVWQAWDNGVGYIRNNTFSGTVSGNQDVGAIIGFYRSLNRYTVIEKNFYQKGSGAARGIGSVLYVDSSIYSNGNSKPLGWSNNVYRFDSSEDDIRRIKQDLNASTAYYNIARENHNRTDDPLGKDAVNLCSEISGNEPAVPYAARLEITGSYKETYEIGESADLQGLTLTIVMSDGSKRKVSLSDAVISGFSSDQAGEGSMTVTVEGCSQVLAYSVRPASGGGKIHVTVTVYGDAVHDSDSDGQVHGLAMGGLSAWVPAQTVEAETSETVWDVLQRVFSANGITPVTSTGSGSVYVAGLIRGGVNLSEFTNGSKSGWMYTLNGTHPLKGVSQQYLSDGDQIVFHYTDDYTKEEGSSGYNSSGSGTSGSTVKNDDAEVKRVESLINAIGSPVTAASADKVRAARKAYNALDYAQKRKVSNYAKLTAAEKQLEKLGVSSGSSGPSAAGSSGTSQGAKNTKNTKDTADTKAEKASEAEVKPYRDIYEKTGDYMMSLGDPQVGTVGGRWMVVGLIRSGREPDTDFYYSTVEAYVTENIDENERLHRAKSTDNSGEILALTAMGKDVSDVAGHNLLMGLTDLAYVRKQGINGPIWALIAFDCGDYEIPENPLAEEQVTRENLVREILDAQLEDGGWALSGDLSDSDMTGMALTALAPYVKNKTVEKAVEKALETLSQMQNEDGSFSAFGGDGGLVPTSESISQVLTALSALGIDGAEDERFEKDKNDILSALCAYYEEGKGFRHLMDGETDGMATEQAYYALTAYFRMREDKTSLYDMTDVEGIGNGKTKKHTGILKDFGDEETAVEEEAADVQGSSEEEDIIAEADYTAEERAAGRGTAAAGASAGNGTAEEEATAGIGTAGDESDVMAGIAGNGNAGESASAGDETTSAGGNAGNGTAEREAAAGNETAAAGGTAGNGAAGEESSAGNAAPMPAETTATGTAGEDASAGNGTSAAGGTAGTETSRREAVGGNETATAGGTAGNGAAEEESSAGNAAPMPAETTGNGTVQESAAAGNAEAAPAGTAGNGTSGDGAAEENETAAANGTAGDEASAGNAAVPADTASDTEAAANAESVRSDAAAEEEVPPVLLADTLTRETTPERTSTEQILLLAVLGLACVSLAELVILLRVLRILLKKNQE